METHHYLNSQGLRLMAALHTPDPSVERLPLALVYLHGWAGYRIGAHQMFTKMARRGVEQGFCSLRFDFRGRGDSEGATSASTLTTMIEDTVHAVEFALAETGLERVAFIGDCSGSEVAIGAGPLHPAVAAQVLWSAPIVAGDRAVSDRAKKKKIIAQYGRKLFRRETWAKLIGGKLRPRQIASVIGGGGRGAGEEGADADKQIDWFDRFVSFPGDRLFIYGGNDPTAEPAVAHYEALCQQAKREFNRVIIPGANHAFYSLAWENKVIDESLKWLKTV
ncbi:MAG: alpha/beta fold hydrolase [Armatimonadota bacterium]